MAFINQDVHGTNQHIGKSIIRNVDQSSFKNKQNCNILYKHFLFRPSLEKGDVLFNFGPETNLDRKGTHGLMLTKRVAVGWRSTRTRIPLARRFLTVATRPTPWSTGGWCLSVPRPSGRGLTLGQVWDWGFFRGTCLSVGCDLPNLMPFVTTLLHRSSVSVLHLRRVKDSRMTVWTSRLPSGTCFCQSGLHHRADGCVGLQGGFESKTSARGVNNLLLDKKRNLQQTAA